MNVSLEISYYPLMEGYSDAVKEFIRLLENHKNITLESGTMSSTVYGEYKVVMDLLTQSLKPLMEQYPSVFVLKISNACSKCNNT